MAFEKDELQQLRTVVREEVRDELNIVRKEIRDEFKVVRIDVHDQLYAALHPIKQDIVAIKDRLDRFFEMESGDIKAAYHEIELLKKHIKKLDQRIAHLERA